MTIVFEDNLVLNEDKSFDESIKVEGDIRCEDGRYSLKVAGDIDARNIDARNIDARNIHARNIDARNIDAGDIDAGDIDAGDIDAWSIDAENIRYYSFCIARSTLKCISIEGRRDNSLHECLDESIEFKEEVEKCSECGRKLEEA